MTVDSSVISTMLIAGAGLIGWLYTQAKAQSKSQRSELRHRRLLGLERGRYVNQLEQALSDKNIDLPVKRPELIAVEEENW